MPTKYVCVRVSGIITQIAKPTDVQGFTEGVLEILLPDETKMTEEQEQEWIEQNNKRMLRLCKFMNENNL